MFRAVMKITKLTAEYRMFVTVGVVGLLVFTVSGNRTLPESPAFHVLIIPKNRSGNGAPGGFYIV